MIRLALIAFFVLQATSLAGDSDSVKVYGYESINEEWGRLKVNYPEGRWDLTKDVTAKRAQYKFESKSSPKVTLHVMFSGGMPEHDAQYEANPQIANDAAILSMALEIAKQDASKISMSIGTVALPEFVGTSSRATVLLNETDVINLEVCNFLVPNGDDSQLAIAALITASKRGEVNQSPEYIATVAEAFAIIQSIEISKAESKSESAE